MGSGTPAQFGHPLPDVLSIRVVGSLGAESANERHVFGRPFGGAIGRGVVGGLRARSDVAVGLWDGFGAEDVFGFRVSFKARRFLRFRARGLTRGRIVGGGGDRVGCRARDLRSSTGFGGI